MENKEELPAKSYSEILGEHLGKKEFHLVLVFALHLVSQSFS